MGSFTYSRLKDTLPDFKNFLLEKKHTDERHVAFYALRVSQFLAFANRNTERDIEIVVQGFLDQMKARDNVSEGLVRQAQDAIRLYLYHYKDGIRFMELRSVQVHASNLSTVADILGEIRRYLRLRHYSYRTEHAYLDWAKTVLFLHR